MSLRRSYFCERFLNEFEAEMSDATSIGELCGSLDRRLVTLGFNSFAYVRFDKGGDGRSYAQVLSGYPSAWRQRYIEANYFAVDPALWRCLGRALPVTWHELRSSEHGRGTASNLFEEATWFGLRDGIAVPLHRPCGGLSVLNASTDLHVRDSAQLLATYGNLVHMISMVFHRYTEQHIRELDLRLPRAEIPRAEVDRLVSHVT